MNFFKSKLNFPRVDEEPEEVEGRDEDPNDVEDNLEVDTDDELDLGEGKITQEYHFLFRHSYINALPK